MAGSLLSGNKGEVVAAISSSSVALAMILLRCSYRLVSSCNKRLRSSRRSFQAWQADDSWMAFATIPLIGRATCIVWQASLSAQGAKTDNLVLSPERSDLMNEYSLAMKLLLPARVFYALL
jgi:hypothetical protein